MLVGDEYRLQTRESAEWEADYRNRYARILADESRIASDRATEFRNAISLALKGITLTQGASKTPRKFETQFSADLPTVSTGAVPVWIRDEWSVSDKTVRDEAQRVGIESPVVFVFLPKQEADALKTALASSAAAKESLDSRPRPTTNEGQEARQAMESRFQTERQKLVGLIAGIVKNARVFQGGGNEVAEGSLHESAKRAIESSLVRLFPNFSIVDSPSWAKVIQRAGDGAPDALAAVGYTGDVENHQACREIRTFIGGSGKRGIEIRKHFTGESYGWPQDAVDGTLLVLITSGLVRAAKNGQPLGVKQIAQAQIGVIDFYSEGKTVTTPQRLAVRKLITDIGLPCKPNEEAEAIPVVLQRLISLANDAGGEPPLPERPSTAHIQQLLALSGNEQFIAVYEQRDQLLNNLKTWSQLQTLARERTPRWQLLQRLLQHARKFTVAAEVGSQVEAITASRALLNNPDPVTPLLNTLANELRSALQTTYQRFEATREQHIASLEASEEWKQLAESARQRILTANALGPTAKLNIGNDEALLATLDATPLVDWEEKLMALPGRIGRVREEAVKSLSPQAVSVHPRHATLKSEHEVDVYLAELREEILAFIKDGKPVIL